MFITQEIVLLDTHLSQRSFLQAALVSGHRSRHFKIWASLANGPAASPVNLAKIILKIMRNFSPDKIICF